MRLRKRDDKKIERNELRRMRGRKNPTHHDERAKSLKLNYVVRCCAGNLCEKKWQKKIGGAFRLELPVFLAFVAKFSAFCFRAASANDIFYCSHVSKLFYDDANPINVHTFQYRSMFIWAPSKLHSKKGMNKIVLIGLQMISS